MNCGGGEQADRSRQAGGFIVVRIATDVKV